MPSHTISVLVENEFGVLARVAGLFSGRGFNIQSLTVNEDPLDPTVSRIVLVSSGDDTILEQINKQLNRLVSVIKVTDFQGVDIVDREMVMVKVAVDDVDALEIRDLDHGDQPVQLFVDLLKDRILSGGDQHDARDRRIQRILVDGERLDVKAAARK